MKTTTYTPLFKVQVSNTYYNTAQHNDLYFLPSSETQELIDKFSMRYTNTNDGFALYVATTQSVNAFLSYIQKVTNSTFFVFTGTAINSNFYQFTDLPVNQTGFVCFDTSESENEVTTNGITLKGAFKPIATTRVAFELKVQFDTLSNYQKTNTVPNLKIKFNARTTQWRYFIVDNYGHNFEQLSITGTSDFQFDMPKLVTLPNGQDATLIASGKTKIPLRAVPEYQLNLINTTFKEGKTRKAIIYKGLPNPNPEAMEIYTENGEDQVASLMYVYV